MAVNDPCIISVAITGSGSTLAQNPNLPCTPEQIAVSAVESWNAGAAIAHIHVREADGTPVHNMDYYREVIQRIRDAGSDIVLNLTTGGYTGLSEEARLEPLQLRPEIGSYDAGSMNFNEHVFENSPAFLRKMANEFVKYDVRPELECFDISQIYNCIRLIDEGLIQGPPYWWQFVLGVKGGAPADPKILLMMADLLPEGSQWSAIGLGRGQLPMNAMAILLGGHPRTGMEDNVYYRYRELARSNGQLVERVARLTRELGREVASPSDARRLLKLRDTAA
jgi:3-keto-5-aminohexanoate cleavage enzyme